jgi:hypothetical protein
VSHDFWCGIPVPACSACDLMVVLAGPGSCVHRGNSCACLEVASRVVLPAPASGCCSYTDSRVLLMGEFGLHGSRAWRHPIGTGSHSAGDGSTASEVAAQGRGWPHWAGGDGGMCFAHPASRHRPARSPGRRLYASRGYCRTLSRGAAWKKDGSGWHSAAE